MAYSSPVSLADRYAAFGVAPPPAQHVFDGITRLAAALFGVPIAAINLVGNDAQWSTAWTGHDLSAPIDDSFCRYVVAEDEVLVIPDAQQDARFASNQNVTGAPHIRFYAGTPLRTPAGHTLGTLCLVDTAPRTLNAPERERLRVLAALAANELALRREKDKRRRTEQKLRESQDRYRALLDQANDATEEAETAHQIQSAFLANMSHELRTPLTAIQGFAELLAETVDTEARGYAERIQQSSERLQRTLTSVLDLAQLESSTLGLDAAPFDLSEAVQKTVDLLRPEAEAKALSLSAQVPDVPVIATHDAAAFNRVLTHLITNAIKFTEADRVTVSLEAGSDHVTLRVRDTGIGIDPAFQERLFEAFAQESSGVTRAFDGVGLGLTITQRLVGLMDGTLCVESNKGQGSTFTVRLPR